jgi:K+-sensing histidine kinase KdpD
MTAFMQDLLMVSKLESGKIELDARPTNIVNVLQEILKEQFTPFKDGRVIELTVKRKENLVSIDSKLIKHVLQNMLQNALKYSLGKQAPTLRVAFSKTYCTISVQDFGIGIPPQEMPKLFTSFFRASNTANISGTGIGLMVVKYFTEQHKGYVAVKSQQNNGTIFTLKIPYNH